MYKTTITYDNFDDESVTDTLYFNFTQQEVVSLNLDQLQAKIENITENHDVDGLIYVFKELILSAYGRRDSEDKSLFRKYDLDGHRLADTFVQTLAFDAYFIKLLSDEKEQRDFLTNILPKSIRGSINMDRLYEESKSVANGEKSIDDAIASVTPKTDNKISEINTNR